MSVTAILTCGRHMAANDIQEPPSKTFDVVSLFFYILNFTLLHLQEMLAGSRQGCVEALRLIPLSRLLC